MKPAVRLLFPGLGGKSGPSVTTPANIFDWGLPSETGWNAFYGGSPFTVSGNRMLMTNVAQYNANTKSFMTLPTAGKYYEVRFNLIWTDGLIRIDFLGGTTRTSAELSGSGDKAFRLLANLGNNALALLITGAGTANNMSVGPLIVEGPYDTANVGGP